MLLAAVVISEFGVVYALVVFNIWNAYFFNSIQDRDWDDFLHALFLFCGIAVWTVAAAMAQYYFGQMLILRDHQMVALGEDMVLVDGTRIALDGRVILADGSFQALVEGQSILIDSRGMAS